MANKNIYIGNIIDYGNQILPKGEVFYDATKDEYVVGDGVNTIQDLMVRGNKATKKYKIYVDIYDGNNATGRLDNEKFPFQTIEFAIQYANTYVIANNIYNAVFEIISYRIQSVINLPPNIGNTNGVSFVFYLSNFGSCELYLNNIDYSVSIGEAKNFHQINLYINTPGAWEGLNVENINGAVLNIINQSGGYNRFYFKNLNLSYHVVVSSYTAPFGGNINYIFDNVKTDNFNISNPFSVGSNVMYYILNSNITYLTGTFNYSNSKSTTLKVFNSKIDHTNLGGNNAFDLYTNISSYSFIKLKDCLIDVEYSTNKIYTNSLWIENCDFSASRYYGYFLLLTKDETKILNSNFKNNNTNNLFFFLSPKTEIQNSRFEFLNNQYPIFLIAGGRLQIKNNYFKINPKVHSISSQDPTFYQTPFMYFLEYPLNNYGLLNISNNVFEYKKEDDEYVFDFNLSMVQILNNTSDLPTTVQNLVNFWAPIFSVSATDLSSYLSGLKNFGWCDNYSEWYITNNQFISSPYWDTTEPQIMLQINPDDNTTAREKRFFFDGNTFKYVKSINYQPRGSNPLYGYKDLETDAILYQNKYTIYVDSSFIKGEYIFHNNNIKGDLQLVSNKIYGTDEFVKKIITTDVYSINIYDNYLIYNGASSTTFTLPDILKTYALTPGKTYKIINNTSNTITLNVSGSDTINNSLTTFTIPANSIYKIYNAKTTWYVTQGF